MLSSIKRTFKFINSHPLAKKHLLICYWRLLKWQIQTSLSSSFKRISFIENTELWARKGLTGVTGNIYTGLHEFNDMSFVLHYLRKNDVLMDVGANVGAYTVLASGVCGSTSIAFEPNPTTFDILKRNVVLNNIEKLVRLNCIGVGSKAEKMHLTTTLDTKNYILYSANNSSISVDIQPLDTFFDDSKETILKIDVEGFEKEVLAGAPIILASPKVKVIIIESNGLGIKYAVEENSVDKILRANEFFPYHYDPFKRALTKLKHYGTLNTIYVKNIDFVSRRIKDGKAFKIFRELI